VHHCFGHRSRFRCLSMDLSVYLLTNSLLARRGGQRILASVLFSFTIPYVCQPSQDVFSFLFSELPLLPDRRRLTPSQAAEPTCVPASRLIADILLPKNLFQILSFPGSCVYYALQHAYPFSGCATIRGIVDPSDCNTRKEWWRRIIFSIQEP